MHCDMHTFKINAVLMFKRKTLQCSSTQSQSKMRLWCSKNKDEYKQSDFVQPGNHTLLDLLHLSRNKYIFFLNIASDVGMSHWT